MAGETISRSTETEKEMSLGSPLRIEYFCIDPMRKEYELTLWKYTLDILLEKWSEYHLLRHYWYTREKYLAIDPFTTRDHYREYSSALWYESFQ
jgi:hypothetical protein